MYFILYLIPSIQKTHVLLPSQPWRPPWEQPLFSPRSSAQGRNSRTVKGKEQKEGGKHHNIFWEVSKTEVKQLFSLSDIPWCFPDPSGAETGKKNSSCPIKFTTVDCCHLFPVLWMINSKNLLNCTPHLIQILQTWIQLSAPWWSPEF